MEAEPLTTDPGSRPNLPQVQTFNGAGPRSRALRFLGVVRRLIDYGKGLAATLQPRAAGSNLPPDKLTFGTRDIALILKRIGRALLLAAALEVICIRRAMRREAPPRTTEPAQRQPQAGYPAERRVREARSLLSLMPTTEEIAAELRRRPATAVLGDIVRDLGLTPAHPLYAEVEQVISENGGNVAAMYREAVERVRLYTAHLRQRMREGWEPDLPPEWWQVWQQASAQARGLVSARGGGGTGPP
jgi:hypothetical protein